MKKSDLENFVDEAARTIADARHVVALVGAGLSAESGIPTFRGPEGLWTKHGEPDLPRLRALPGGSEVLVGTAHQPRQPVPGDGRRTEQTQSPTKATLRSPISSEWAGCSTSSPRTSTTCIRWPARRLSRKSTATARSSDALRAPLAGPWTSSPSTNCLRHCPECGGVVKGDTVMFGEPIPRDALDECIAQTPDVRLHAAHRHERRRLPGGRLSCRREDVGRPADRGQSRMRLR